MAGKKNKLNRALARLENLAINEQRSVQASTRRRRRRRNRNRRNGGNIPAGYATSPAQRVPRLSTPSGGGLRIRHMEYWTELKGTASQVRTFPFALGAASATMPLHLTSLSKAYDRYMLNGLTLHYRPSVGTTKDGYIVLAIDWDAGDSNPTVAKARAFQPQVRIPVWQPADLPCPARKLQDLKVLYVGKTGEVQHNPFSVQAVVPLEAATKESVYGDLYVTYDITFEGVSGNS